jgi:hypothetical protein
MKRLAVGAALGGVAAYLYDPEFGVERRAQFTSLIREGKARALKVGQTASPIVESARPLAQRVTTSLGSIDLMQPIKRVQPLASLRKMLGAAAVGAAIVYFTDPVKGSARRKSAFDAGRRAFRQLAVAVEPMPGRVSDLVAESFETFKAKAS